MATALTEPIAAVEQPAGPVRTPRRVWSGRGRRWAAGLVLLVLAALPAVLGMRDVLLDDEPGHLLRDQALQELHVHDAGSHQELLGAYSRFGWYHPGPLATYLLAVPYRLMDGANGSLTVGALAIAAISSVGAVFLVRRRAGLLAAVWALLVLTVGVRLLGGDLLRDIWNPHLPVLPFLLGVLLCWTAIRGDAWALPVAVVPLSLAVQSHAGYLAPVGAVGAVLAVGLLGRALHRLRRRGDGGGRRPPARWAVASVAAVVVGLVLWLPPIAQQIGGTPGNLGALLDYLRAGATDPTLSSGTAVRMVGEEFGRLPGYVAGAGGAATERPVWATVVGVAFFVVALVVAALRRRGDALWLGALTLALAVAGIAALVRIDGPWAPYLTRWTAVIGVLAWITVGLGLLPELRTGLGRLLGPARRPLAGALLGVPLVVLATVAAVVTAGGVARAETPATDPTDEVARLGQAVVDDLDRLGLRAVPDPAVVRVDFAISTGPEFLGTTSAGPALVVELVEDDVDVQVLPRWGMPFGQRYVERVDEAGYVVTVALAEGSAFVAEPWQQVLAVGPQWQVYGGVPPVG